MLLIVSMWEFGLHVTKHLGFLMENGNLDFYERLIFFKCLQKHLQANKPGASHLWPLHQLSVKAVTTSAQHSVLTAKHWAWLRTSTQSRMNE